MMEEAVRMLGHEPVRIGTAYDLLAGLREVRVDAALSIAVRLGHELDLKLTVVHVMSLAERGQGGLAAEARYADAVEWTRKHLGRKRS